MDSFPCSPSISCPWFWTFRLFYPFCSIMLQNVIFFSFLGCKGSKGGLCVSNHQWLWNWHFSMSVINLKTPRLCPFPPVPVWDHCELLALSFYPGSSWGLQCSEQADLCSETSWYSVIFIINPTMFTLHGEDELAMNYHRKAVAAKVGTSHWCMWMPSPFLPCRYHKMCTQPIATACVLPWEHGFSALRWKSHLKYTRRGTSVEKKSK